MNILIDREIYRKEIFSGLGDLKEFEHRDLPGVERFSSEIDILVVRSVTRVDALLLKKFPNLKLVLTPTIGTDHIDWRAFEELRRAGKEIGFYHSPGATAPAVGDYVAVSISTYCEKSRVDISGMKVAVVGYGNCGKAVKSRLERLGVRDFIIYDPPLEERTKGRFRSAKWEDIFEANMITFHCPLTRPDESEYPTFHMADEDFFSHLARHTIIINTSRGGVIGSGCLLRALRSGHVTAILDVFENEPEIESEIAELVFIATPHIAGSSYEGKWRAVKMIYDSAVSFFGVAGADTSAAEEERGSASFADVKDFIMKVSAGFKRLLSENRGRVTEIFNKIRAASMRHEIKYENR